MTDLVTTLEQKANDLRIHSIMSTATAGSGHPTTCMSCAEIISTLFFHAMRYDPKNPDNPNNDRFILSKGHAAPILYAAWAELGIISRENLLDLRKIDSDLEGHPTPRLDWIDVATGSLGQGLSVGVGMAINSKYLDKTDYRVYVLLGDGETVEGSVWEAVALASHYQLNNLIGIVDVNGIGQSQRTMYESDIDSYCRRFESFGWRAIGVDGHNVEQILSAIDHVKGNTDQPTMIVAKTFKGKGVSFLEDADGWHGKAILGDQLDQALEELGQLSTNSNVEIEMPSMVSLPTPEIGEMEPPDYQIGEEVATRSGYGTALAKLGDVNPLVVALDGDTKNSTYAQELMTNHSDRYFEMFIAEQNLVGAELVCQNGERYHLCRLLQRSLAGPMTTFECPQFHKQTLNMLALTVEFQLVKTAPHRWDWKIYQCSDLFLTLQCFIRVTRWQQNAWLPKRRHTKELFLSERLVLTQRLFMKTASSFQLEAVKLFAQAVRTRSLLLLLVSRFTRH